MSQSPNDGLRLQKDGIPEGLWMRCPECGDMLFRKVVDEALHVCPGCQYHFRISARTRIELICDPGTFEERFTDIYPADPLEYVDKKSLRDRLKAAQPPCRRVCHGVYQGPADNDDGDGSDVHDGFDGERGG